MILTFSAMVQHSLQSAKQFTKNNFIEFISRNTFTSQLSKSFTEFKIRKNLAISNYKRVCKKKQFNKEMRYSKAERPVLLSSPYFTTIYTLYCIQSFKIELDALKNYRWLE